ncbi:enoyl-CoA hydratase [Marinobacter sp.]|uniref:enoyl-CoA hydratase n=1 Tax=Marinobacter sp. TaxID=50741 RepID=UPI00384B5C84
MSDLVLTKTTDQTLVVRINRLSRKNALTWEMYSALADALKTAEADNNIRCVLFTGSDDCFTAGNDLGEFAEGLPGDFRSTPVGRFLFGLATSLKPVVAAVNGPAVGIGTTMLLHCDLVYAGNNSRFQMPFANLGLCPEGGSSLLLPQWLGRVRAAELLMLGGAFSADDAHRLGLINRVCEPADTESTALEACQRVSAQPPAAIRATRDLLNRSSFKALEATMLEEGELFVERLKSPEAAEAFRAFAEKRKPDFSGFR